MSLRDLLTTLLCLSSPVSFALHLRLWPKSTTSWQLLWRLQCSATARPAGDSLRSGDIKKSEIDSPRPRHHFLAILRSIVFFLPSHAVTAAPNKAELLHRRSLFLLSHCATQLFLFFFYDTRRFLSLFDL